MASDLDQDDNRPEAERLSDVSDRATAEETRQNMAALRENTLALRQRQQPRADGTYEFTDCEDCGNEIGEGRLRLAAANHLCVYCATAEEQLKKRGLSRLG